MYAFYGISTNNLKLKKYVFSVRDNLYSSFKRETTKIDFLYNIRERDLCKTLTFFVKVLFPVGTADTLQLTIHDLIVTSVRNFTSDRPNCRIPPTGYESLVVSYNEPEKSFSDGPLLQSVLFERRDYVKSDKKR